MGGGPRPLLPAASEPSATARERGYARLTDAQKSAPHRSNVAGRAFLLGCAALALLLVVLALLARLAAWNRRDVVAEAWMERHTPLYGVNVGGWLVLEKWLCGTTSLRTKCCGEVASPYSAAAAGDSEDEFSLTARLRAADELDAIDAFRSARVSSVDFEAMASAGVTAVRVPFPWWVAREPAPPGSEAWREGAGGYHVGRGIELLDQVVSNAERHSLSLLLELHAAPGGQSGRQTTGRSDPTWEPSRFDADGALSALRLVATRYNSSRSVVAISPLNEPELPNEVLLPYYQRAYETVRGSGMRAGQVAFVLQLYGLGAIFSLGWAALDSPEGLPAARYPNIIFDLHLYYGVLVPPFPALFDRLASPHFVAGPLVHLESMLLDVGSRPALTGECDAATERWRSP